MTDPSRKRLLVEGKDDLHCVVELMRPHIGWPKNAEPVKIEDCHGRELLNDLTIPLWLKSTDAEILGILVDANGNCQARWQRIRQLCAPHAESLPQKIPPDGLVVSTKRGTRLGVWIMPDNEQPGMLETFLQLLVPEEQQPLWKYAEEATVQSKERGATYNNVHIDKAKIHTWLAWLEPPGKPFGTAFVERLLNSGAPAAIPFVEWFRKLFQL